MEGILCDLIVFLFIGFPVTDYVQTFSQLYDMIQFVSSFLNLDDNGWITIQVRNLLAIDY